MMSLKYITSTPKGEKIIGMINFQGRVLVCSDAALYELLDEELVKVEIVDEAEHHD